MKSFIAATFIAAVAALPASTSCAPASVPTTAPTTEPTEFGGLALRSASPIHFGEINANGGSFWINKNTTVYTPENTIPAPKNPYTAFVHSNSTGGLGLKTVVPGGQQVYVDAAANGELKFTQAHSANTGTNGTTTGFTVSGERLLFENESFYACPLGAENGSAYGIYAVSRVEGSNAGASCLGFSFLTATLGNETEAVWQYQ